MGKKLKYSKMKKAFSVLELMVVLAITSMVIGTMKIHLQNKKVQAEAKNIVEIVEVYKLVLSMYYLKNGGAFPETSGHIEDIARLRPYCPADFNTKEMIKSKKCKDITYSYAESILKIFIELEDEPELTDEIGKRLYEFAAQTQIFIKKSPGEFSITFYIKNGQNIYI